MDLYFLRAFHCYRCPNLIHSSAYQCCFLPASFHKSLYWALLPPKSLSPTAQLCWCLDPAKFLQHFSKCLVFCPPFSHDFSSIFCGCGSKDLLSPLFILGQAISMEEIASNNPPCILGQVLRSASLWIAREERKHSEVRVRLIEQLHSQNIFLDGTFLLDAMEHYKGNSTI